MCIRDRIYLQAVLDVTQRALDIGVITWDEIGDIDRIEAELLEEISGSHSIYTLDRIHSVMTALLADLREAIDPPWPLAATNGAHP